ncbi:MAG: pyridoxamine 5'-phosphate oxidase family protein [Chloroflexi bacterium]|jgi:hypothetical protein|nr:pyridoxamine 5'-phosphate oxidase family protein [Chloroflexota bacterium]GIW09099.1 MAG: pyridoxamine 5'-phosphate oxidase [Dehalococcoidia bacterium]
MVPLRERPQLPEGYGVPTGDEGLLPWSWAEARLIAAPNFWFSTTRPDGRPHAVPAWGVWLDGALYFEGSPATRRARNLAHNPALVVHLEDGTQVLILEGEAAPAHPPASALAERLAAEFGRKYGPTHDYRPSPDQWNAGGLWVMRPRVAFGWDRFPTGLTRWRFSAARA